MVKVSNKKDKKKKPKLFDIIKTITPIIVEIIKLIIEIVKGFNS